MPALLAAMVRIHSSLSTACERLGGLRSQTELLPLTSVDELALVPLLFPVRFSGIGEVRSVSVISHTHRLVPDQCDATVSQQPANRFINRVTPAFASTLENSPLCRSVLRVVLTSTYMPAVALAVRPARPRAPSHCTIDSCRLSGGADAHDACAASLRREAPRRRCAGAEARVAPARHPRGVKPHRVGPSRHGAAVVAPQCYCHICRS